MPIYDTTVILNPQLEESGIDGRIKEIVGRIEENGGKMVRENRMGMRRLAYEIQKLSQGYYVTFVYDGNGDLVKELERKFRLDESCLRFLTCLYQEVAPPKERVVSNRPAATTTTPTTAPSTPAAPTTAASTPATDTPTPASSEPVAEKAPATTPATDAPTPASAEPVAEEAPAAPATPEAPAQEDSSATEMEEL